ncbi:MAG TPA: FAD-dependent monooxygenase [Methyloceanibacter sp.]|nr:FAD-dependent monooxygenase [Methyloceanibacter sp.]
MPKTEERVLIAGGGIGGLSAAIALARRGIGTDVLERSRFAEETGAGIQLGPNATRVLAALGVLDLIEPHAFTPEAIVIYDGLSGRKLTSMPLGKEAQARYGAPYLTLHRADLHAALRAAAESQPHVALRPGFEVTAVDTQGPDVLLRSTEGKEVKGAALIGADGLWSTIRPLIMPQAGLRFTGATAWRTLLPREGLPPPFDAPAVGLWLGARSHLVHYPVRGGSDLNVVAVTEGGAELQGWNQAGNAKALLAGFARWTKDSKSLLERASTWRSWSLYRLDNLRRFSEGRIALLGDAAHPVLPYLAQGAALAIEDAATLADCMSASLDHLSQAFDRYERVRRPRSLRVQRQSRRFGQLYHLDGAFRLARNFVLERRREEQSLRRFDWLYQSAGRQP